MMCDFVKLCVVFSAIVTYCVQADSLDDVKKRYTGVILACAQENKITPDEIKQLDKTNMLAAPENAKCLFACAYKKIGMMDEQGMMSIEGINNITRDVYNNDPEKLKRSAEMIEACKAVNDVAVSDGAKGCERAALILKCSIDNGPGVF